MQNTLPEWYWSKGLHDAELLEIHLEGDTLTLRLDSRGAVMQNDLREIRLYGCRLKTPLPQPGRKCHVYWLSDTLTPLPDGQWKLSVTFEVLTHGKTERQPLTAIFETAETVKAN